MRKSFFLFFIFFFSLTLKVFSANYYFDPTYTGGNGTPIGTYQRPWNTLAQINAYSFSTGDDVYMRVGTTYRVTSSSERLYIDWHGTSSDRVIFGAYYGENQFGLGGGARPILDGAEIAYGNESAFVTIGDNQEYVTIKDIEVYNSFWYGIGVRTNANYALIQNCYVHHTVGHGIVLGRTHDSRVTGCLVQYSGYHRTNYGRVSVGNIIISAADMPNGSYNNRIDHNIVWDGYAEGIDIALGASNNIVENNIVFDSYNVLMYIDAANYNIIRNNIFYSSATGFGGYRRTPNGIHINLEHVRCIQYPATYNVPVAWSVGNVVYGNLVFGVTNGLYFNTELASLGCDNTGIAYNRFFNNTVVDSSYNQTFGPNTTFWEGNESKNNLSYTITAGMLHGNLYSPPDILFDHNLYDDTSGTDYTNILAGNASRNAVFGNPALTMSSGWRSVPRDGIDLNTTWANPLSTSQARNRATHLSTIRTTTTSANMPVNDVFWFAPGMLIAVDSDNNGTVDFIEEVLGVTRPDPESLLYGTITLANSHSYTAGGRIWLSYSDTIAWYGTSPEIGAKEYTGDTAVIPGGTTPPEEYSCDDPPAIHPTLNTSDNYGGENVLALYGFWEKEFSPDETPTCVTDMSGNGHHATLVNPIWANDGLIIRETDQTCAVPISFLDGIDKYSIVMVFVSDQQECLTPYGKFFHYNYPDVRGFQLERNVDDLTWLLDVGGASYPSIVFNVQDQFDQTPHIFIVTANDSQNRRILYQDGGLVGLTLAEFSNPEFSNFLYLGGKGDGERIAGLKLQLVGFYEGEMALSDAQLLKQNPYRMIDGLTRAWESGDNPPVNLQRRLVTFSQDQSKRTTFLQNRSKVTTFGN